MPLVAYKAINSNGKQVSGLRIVSRQADLAEVLGQADLYLVGAHTMGSLRKLGLTHKRRLFHELSSMLAADVTLPDALALLGEEEARYRDAVLEWKRGVEAGRAFSECVAASPDIASPLIIKMLSVGETTGRLAACLQEIADYYQNLERLRRKLVSAIAYPSVVLSVSIIAVVVLVTHVIPMFLEMFARYQVELPAMTRLLLFISNAAADYGWILPPLSLLLYYAFRLFGWSRSARLYALLDRLPLIGKVMVIYRRVSFYSALHTLLAADVRIHEAVGLMEGLYRDPRMNQTLARASERITRGDALSSALADSAAFPRRDVKLLKIGEETGRIEAQCKHLGSDYEEKLEAILDTVLSLFEPVMIVMLAVVIGFILVGLYLPLFDMLGAGGRVR